MQHKQNIIKLEKRLARLQIISLYIGLTPQQKQRGIRMLTIINQHVEAGLYIR